MPVMRGGQVQAGLDREDRDMVLIGYYSFATQGGVQGAINLVDESGHVVGLPDNLIIKSAVIQCTTALTSAGSATVAVGTSQSGKSAIMLAATAYSSAPFNAVDAVASAAAALPALVTGTTNTLTATIATADLTAGAFTVTIHGYIGD